MSNIVIRCDLNNIRTYKDLGFAAEDRKQISERMQDLLFETLKQKWPEARIEMRDTENLYAQVSISCLGTLQHHGKMICECEKEIEKARSQAYDEHIEKYRQKVMRKYGL